MDTVKGVISRNNRFTKLSLKKNRLNVEKTNLNRSSDVIILDDSFDRLRADFPKTIRSTPKQCTPIVIDDSCELSNDEDLPAIAIQRAVTTKPSKTRNVSFNESIKETPQKNSHRPSFNGWSPAQNIICATPKNEPAPSTPRDIANESLKECSLEKIVMSQKKLLDDLYGNTWKTIPRLFKTVTKNCDNYDGVSKKLQFNDDDSDKENVKIILEEDKKIYLTDSETKRQFTGLNDTEKRSKKKLYTEKVPATPEPKKIKRNAKSTSKKLKGKSVTELVESLSDIDILSDRVKNVSITKNFDATLEVKRISFMGSLAENVPSWRRHPESFQYIDDYKGTREQLTRRLFVEFNRVVFDNALDNDLPIIWDTKLRSTAGTATNRLVKTPTGARIRTCSIKLSSKVLDAPHRLRDTLIHELCHAATWLIDGQLRAGHGPLWRKWATIALRAFPELGEISRCHDMEIHFKYSYKCTKCGYSIQRHSKSIDITKKCCGYCRGTFEIKINKKDKDGQVVSTPARKGNTNDFAKYVKENYAATKDGTKTHAQVMKLLGEQFSARKNKPS